MAIRIDGKAVAAEIKAKVAEDVAFFAEKEGLSAHARSATVRFIDEAK